MVLTKHLFWRLIVEVVIWIESNLVHLFSYPIPGLFFKNFVLSKVKDFLKANRICLAMMPASMAYKFQMIDVVVGKLFKDHVCDNWAKWMLNESEKLGMTPAGNYKHTTQILERSRYFRGGEEGKRTWNGIRTWAGNRRFRGRRLSRRTAQWQWSWSSRSGIREGYQRWRLNLYCKDWHLTRPTKQVFC